MSRINNAKTENLNMSERKKKTNWSKFEGKKMKNVGPNEDKRKRLAMKRDTADEWRKRS